MLLAGIRLTLDEYEGLPNPVRQGLALVALWTGELQAERQAQMMGAR